MRVLKTLSFINLSLHRPNNTKSEILNNNIKYTGDFEKYHNKREQDAIVRKGNCKVIVCNIPCSTVLATDTRELQACLERKLELTGDKKIIVPKEEIRKEGKVKEKDIMKINKTLTSNIIGRERNKGTTGTNLPENKTPTYRQPNKILITERMTI